MEKIILIQKALIQNADLELTPMTMKSYSYLSLKNADVVGSRFFDGGIHISVFFLTSNYI
jgi:hypothetical protein